MKKKLLTFAVSFFVLIILAVGVVLAIVPAKVDRARNPIKEHAKYKISEYAQKLHDSLVVGDWHADSLLWSRDLSKLNSIGHLDIPRMQQGNVGLQMFTTVTKSPSGLNYLRNETDAVDNITRLAIAQRWPKATWTSLLARAEHQASKLHKLEENNKSDLMIIKSQADLKIWQQRRITETKLVGALLGTEGSHALDGKLENVQVLFNQGFRMMSLQHFFDNKLGASLHGSSKAGLTNFGEQVVNKVNHLGIILDVSHSSEAVVADVLKLSTKPLVVSHTGFKGHCNTPRNISDSLVKQITNKGGLIAVGYWNAAVCGTSPKDIANAIIYGIDLVGAEHVSLGSDFDGSVKTALGANELAAITQALLDANVSEAQIKKVMGGNMLTFLSTHLPN